MTDVLLMTSTIAPSKQAALLVFRDPEQRLREYATALSFYVDLLRRNVFDKLVYADNSGHDLGSLAKIAEEAGVADRCEFLSFVQTPPPEANRYYLETQLLIEAMARSRFLAEENAAIWKITGRYLIVNLERIIRRAPKTGDLYINCRNHPTRVVDFYLTRFTRPVFDRLLAANLEEFAGLRTGEETLRERIDRNSDPAIKVIPRFNETPRIMGTRGFDGARYGGAKDHAKFVVRSALNTLLPGIWV
jgi:hypothetical protein